MSSIGMGIKKLLGRVRHKSIVLGLLSPMARCTCDLEMQHIKVMPLNTWLSDPSLPSVPLLILQLVRLVSLMKVPVNR